MKKGQTLTILLVFMSIAITVVTAAVSLSVSGTQNATQIEVSDEAFSVAESGMENALIRILRDPSYTGETLSVGNGTATITVSGTSPVVITSTGIVGNYSRTVQVSGNFAGVIFNINSWTQTF